MTADRLCDWCRKVVLADVRARFCSRRCRQTAHRLRRRAALGDASFGAEGRQVGASRGAPADGSVTSMDGRRVGPAADGMGDGRAA